MFCSLLKSFFSPHKYFIFKGLFIYSNSYFSDKGLVSIQGKSHQVIVQGVHELYDLEETAVAWKEDEKRTNRLVLIGRNLNKEIIKEVFIETVSEKHESS